MKARSFFFLVFILYNCILLSNGSYNILVTVVGVAASQNLIMLRLAELLGQRGHDVTILKAEVFPEAKSIKLKYSKQIVYSVIKNKEETEDLKVKMQDNAWNSTVSDNMRVPTIKQFFRVLAKGCDEFLSNKVLIDQLKTKKYDVIVIHMGDFCSFGLAQHLGIKGTIWMSTAFIMDFMNWYAGAPSPISYAPIYPNTFQDNDHVTFVDRLKNVATYTILMGAFQYGIVWTYTDLFRKHFGPDFPTFGELLHKTQLYYINSDPLFEFPRPVLHNIIYVGGLTMENFEPLPSEWQKIVNDSGTHGLVVFSLGSVTNTSLMPTEIKNAFTNAFKKIKQAVIWRLEGDTRDAKKVPNIYITEWIPQKDLLINPAVKAFITHGGYNSLTEATYSGVPLIMFPLFGDQFANCKRVERLNVGVTLYRQDLTEGKILDALNYVLNNQTIQQNARRLGKMIRNKPYSSRELALKWIEYLAEFQDLSQLIPLGQRLTLIEYFMTDVAACLILASFAILYVLFYLFCKICCRKIISRKKEKIH